MRFQEAQAHVSDALRDDPNLALAHEANGLLSYFKQDFPAAESEFKRATELSASSSPAFYYLAASQMHQGTTQMDQMQTITAALEKAISLNSQFAPAYAALSQFYSMNPETHEKAFAMGKKAVELEPGNLRYAMNLGFVLVNLGKVGEARFLADRIQAAARNPQEIQMADSLRRAADMRAMMGQSVEVRSQPPPDSAAPTAPGTTKDIAIPEDSESPPVSAPTASTSGDPPPTSMPVRIAKGPEYRLEGKVAAADCKPTGDLVVSLSINTVLMKFHTADWKSVEITPDARAISAASPSCSNWKAQRAEVVFRGNARGEFDGELVALHFR